MNTALRAVLLVAMAALIVYQVYMLRWTSRMVGSIPRPVLALRVVNVVLLTAGAALIVWALTR
jgi:hypothetical protein